MQTPLFRIVALCLAGFSVAACVDIVESSPEAVWVKKPLIAFGSVEGTAAAECEEYGRQAVFEGTLEHRYPAGGSSTAATGGSRTVYVPIYAFNCQ